MNAALSWGGVWDWLWRRDHILLLCMLLECSALLLCFRALIELYCIKEQGKREGDYSPIKFYQGSRVSFKFLRRAIFELGNDSRPRWTHRIDLPQALAKSLWCRFLNFFR